MLVDFRNMTSLEDFKYTPGGSMPTFDPDTVRFGVARKTKSARFPVASVVFGQNVTDKLGWQAGDKVSIAMNDEHLWLARNNAGSWTLRKQKTDSGRLVVSFSLPVGKYSTAQSTVTRHVVQHSIINGGIALEW